MAVQWFRLEASNAGDTGSIPGWGTKTLHATWCDSHCIPPPAKKKKDPNQGTAINVVTNYLGHRGRGSHGEAGDCFFSLPPSYGRVYTCTDLCVGVCTRVIPQRDEPGRKPEEPPHPSRNRPRLPAVPRLGKGPTELFWVS